MNVDQENSGKSTQRSFARITRIATLLTLLCGIAFLSIGSFFDSIHIPITHLRLQSTWCQSIGAVVMAIGIVCQIARWPGLAFSTSFFSLLLLTTVLISWQPPKEGQRIVHLTKAAQVVNSKEDVVEEHVSKDATYAFRGMPNKSARHVTKDFETVYDLDSEGWRVLPEPTPPVEGDIYFVGCSFTFGSGVSDEETYVARLAKSAWSHYRLHNYSLGGYGTNHALVSVQKALSQTPAPKIIFYGFIDNHLKRISKRRVYHEKHAYTSFLMFDPNGESPQIVSLNPENTLPEGQVIDALELQTARSLINRMKELCENANIPFVLLILNTHDRRDIQPILDLPRLRYIDLSRDTTRVYPHDGHPDSISHLKIAHDIATDPRVAEWSGISDLFQPKAFPEANQLWLDYHYTVYNGDTYNRVVRIDPPIHNATRSRFSIDGPPSQDPSCVRLIRAIGPVKRGRHYAVSMRTQFQQSKSIRISVLDHDDPRSSIWLGSELPLGHSEQEKYFRFRAARDSMEAAVVFHVGGIEGELEINDLKFMELDHSDSLELAINPPQPKSRNCKARLKVDDKNPSVWRIEEIYSPSMFADNIGIASHGHQVIKGHRYHLAGKVRCDRGQRTFDVHFYQTHAPYEAISKSARVEVTGPQWQEFTADWQSSIDDDDVTLQFNVGESEIPMELGDLQLRDVTNDSRPAKTQ